MSPGANPYSELVWALSSALGSLATGPDPGESRAQWLETIGGRIDRAREFHRRIS